MPPSTLYYRMIQDNGRQSRHKSFLLLGCPWLLTMNIVRMTRNLVRTRPWKARNKYTNLYIINCLQDVLFVVPTELYTHWVICTCLWTYNAVHLCLENRKLWELSFVTDCILCCEVMSGSPNYVTMFYTVTFFKFRPWKALWTAFSTMNFLRQSVNGLLLKRAADRTRAVRRVEFVEQLTEM